MLLATILLPLAGRVFMGEPLDRLWQFPPPLAMPEDFPRFSWFAVAALVVAIALLLLPWVLFPRRRATPEDDLAPPAPERRFPFWGWLAVDWTLLWWFIAWTRIDALSAIQPHTFFPLWLGFILVLNALVIRRTGSALLTRAPGKWLTLFLASAVFWWAFEWLNRFVDNWHYLGAAHFSAFRYGLHATICFATVLPAVLAMREWLGSFATLQCGLGRGPIISGLGHGAFALFLIAVGILGLFGLGAWPAFFYPAVWAAPLALLWGLRRLLTHSGMLCELAMGDWKRPATWALAALGCGFFWEMWNLHSMPKWLYAVPYVDRWHLFEMPIFGYLGYLPFGIVCGWAVEALVGER